MTPPPPVRHFRLNPRGLTVAECWRTAADWPAFQRLLGAKLGSSWVPPGVLTLAMTFPAVTPEEFSPAANRRVVDPIGRLIGCGYRVVAHGRTPQLDPVQREHHTVLLLDDSRHTGASVTDIRTGAVRHTGTVLTTRFADGTFGLTLSERRTLASPPDREADYRPGTRADDLHDRHLRNQARWEAAGRVIDSFRSDEGPAVSSQLTRGWVEFQSARGALVELSPEEVAALRTVGKAHP